MKVKVCGLCNTNNIQRIQSLNVDFLGFIFYPESSRYLHPKSQVAEIIRSVNRPTVGVFVNESVDHVHKVSSDFQLDYVQLHGSETPEEVTEIRKSVKTIKVLSVDDDFDFKTCLHYESDLFLFDTKGKKPGGNGFAFNWDKLNEYEGETPFLLSGGIRLIDLDRIQKLGHPKLYGVDINSGFETEPGIKNPELIEQFVNELKREEIYC